MGHVQHECKHDARHDVSMVAEQGIQRRRLGWQLVVLFAAIVAFVGFIALGNWQLERRAWKQDLMARVAERVNASPVAAPLPSEWQAISRERDEYRAVRVKGEFIDAADTPVVAATELGSGYWIMSPLRTRSRGTILVNRGFVAQGGEPAPVPAGPVEVTGLLRLSEPGGSFLRDNVPADNRWYSRDVGAIGSALNLSLAPYFIDAAAQQPGSPGLGQSAEGPVGGLTVVRFHNSHLVYALTWYALALMVVIAGVIVVREQRKLRQS